MRYIRQEIFKEIGRQGQKKLGKSSVVIIGVGALGSASAELMARAGIGNIILIDRDVVELSNLQRQSLYDEGDIGKPKAMAAKEHLNKINSEIQIKSVIDDLNYNNITKIIKIKNHKKNIDLILDCTDNLETRFLINDFSVKNKIPFIYSSAVGSKGYVFNIITGRTACLRCFLKEAAQLETCDTAGVLNSITHLVSSLQSNEAIKIMLNKNYEKCLLFFDVWKNELIKIKVNKNKGCICCSKKSFEYLDGKKFPPMIKLCGDNMYQIRGKFFDKGQFSELKNRLKKAGKITDFDYCINFDRRLTIFNDGRALIKAKDEKEAKSLYSRFVGN
ncbi:ThiF family adenylyltransferase [Candidatus Woesearchaeota archaeon]|nr:ThiF family adenylyltransferase [Candidatus Woesearchaeota archaeon]